jgi:hypothetical protein
MTEQRFFHGQRSARAQPVSPNPNRSGIPVRWSEGAVRTIVIVHPRAGMATKLWRMDLKAGRLQGLNAAFVLNDEGRRILSGMPERRAS